MFAEAVPPQQVDVCFLGDSITQRGLFSEFFPGLAVSNRGIGSDTSEGVLKRLDTVVNGNPDTIVLMIGINDLGLGVQEDSIVSNADKIVTDLENSLPGSRVVVMGVLPAGNVDELKIRSLNERYAEMASSHENALFLNLHDEYLFEEGSQDMSLYDADGVHLNGSGYKIWIDAISQLLRQ